MWNNQTRNELSLHPLMITEMSLFCKVLRLRIYSRTFVIYGTRASVIDGLFEVTEVLTQHEKFVRLINLFSISVKWQFYVLTRVYEVVEK